MPFQIQKLETSNKNSHEHTRQKLQVARKYWEVLAHCENVLLPQPKPEISFNRPATNYHYQRLANRAPDREMLKLITQAHHGALARLNQSQLQVKNFILPVQLMKMKFMDPLTRRKTIEGICKYLSKELRVIPQVISFQQGLYNIVLEQAELKFEHFCRLMVAIARSSKVRSLFLWHVLDRCEKPFRGPLQSDIVLDDLPRIPYTFNPGGRKYLRDLRKTQREIFNGSQKVVMSEETLDKKHASKSNISFLSEMSLLIHNHKLSRVDSKPLPTHLEKVRGYLNTSTSGEKAGKAVKKEVVQSVSDYADHVFSQADVGIQCQISRDLKEKNIFHDVTSAHYISRVESHETHSPYESRGGNSANLNLYESYLKYYENTKMDVDVLRYIYTISLNSLTHLTKLAVNYCMLADGTGNALMSIGSVANGRLQHLKLLCEPDDIPSPTHQLYGDKALQAIPDMVWHSVKEKCPDLKVHMVCVSTSAYDVTKRFVTKSVPLSSFFMENGFCPTLVVPELNVFCVLKWLWLDHAKTLEHINFTMWHSVGKIDIPLVKLIEKTQLLSFAYQGPLMSKSSAYKMCEAALNSSKLNIFKLMIQGDSCFPNNAQEFTTHLYEQYRHRFHDKSIQFTLETFRS